MTDVNMIGPDTRIARSDEPVAVEVDRTVVMMSVEQGKYFGLEGPGGRIWALMEHPRTPREMRDTLLDEFAVDPDRCLQDICDFLEELRRAGLVHIP